MKVFSGIQPTGKLHIGNYLGAIKQWIKLQEEHECIFFITDLHSLTVPYDPKSLQKRIIETATDYLACGLDPEKCIIFTQSDVKEHTELCWLLNTVTPIGELERMTQYKEKSKQFRKNVNAGLLDYPVLQAADILLYETDVVPIGKDQIQHVELTRTIARKFNKRFGKTFKIPKPILLKVGKKIMALNDPKKKMSKSSPETCLFLFDSPITIKKKIMSAVTDTGKEVKYDPIKKPGISNLLIIYSLITDKSIKDLEKEFKNKGYAIFKKSLAEELINFLKPIHKKKREIERRKTYVEEILLRGAKRAKIIASSTIQKTRKKMGLE